MKTTEYYARMKTRPDRAGIRDEWVMRVVHNPARIMLQSDGRVRRWGKITEAGEKYLRVILLADGETVHNAFFDSGYKPRIN